MPSIIKIFHQSKERPQDNGSFSISSPSLGTLMGGLSAAQPVNDPEGVGWQVSTHLEPCVLEERSAESTGR